MQHLRREFRLPDDTLDRHWRRPLATAVARSHYPRCPRTRQAAPFGAIEMNLADTILAQARRRPIPTGIGTIAGRPHRISLMATSRLSRRRGRREIQPLTQASLPPSICRAQRRTKASALAYRRFTNEMGERRPAEQRFHQPYGGGGREPRLHSPSRRTYSRSRRIRWVSFSLNSRPNTICSRPPCEGHRGHCDYRAARAPGQGSAAPHLAPKDGPGLRAITRRTQFRRALRL